jgi:hypothetical protein
VNSGDEGDAEFENADDLEDSVATLQEAYHDASAQEHSRETTKEEESIYRGRIEAVKLTGDPNIPRGEYTFIAPDIGPNGLLRVASEELFKGARIVKSVGHIAARGFRDGKFTSRGHDQALTIFRYLHDFSTHPYFARPTGTILGDVWSCVLLPACQHRELHARLRRTLRSAVFWVLGRWFYG